MSSLMRLGSILIFCFPICITALSGCSFLQKEVDVTPLPVKPDLKLEQEKLLSEAEDLYLSKKYQNSSDKYHAFIQKYPQSVFLAQANMGLAKSEMALGKYLAASETFRRIVNMTRSTQPQFAASALYSSSYCYEMLGDETRLMASLKDAEVLKDKLPEEVRIAELPARLASINYRLGRKIEAEQYFQQADRGMMVLKARPQPQVTKSWISKTYFQMGSLYTSQLSADNVPSHIDSLTYMQYFLLRAIEESGEPWAQHALDNLKRNYLDLWTAIMSWPKDPALDPVASQKAQNISQAKWLLEVLTSLEKLRSYLMPDPQNQNARISSLMTFLSEMEIKSREFVYNSGVLNELTPESERRSGIKREGVIRAQ